MRKKIDFVVSQRCESGKIELLCGHADSFEDMICLINLITNTCENVKFAITVTQEGE